MKGYMLLAELHKQKEVEVSDKETLFAQIKELASNPNPNNRYEIAQLVSFTVDAILDTRLNWLDLIADVKRGGVADNPEFKVPYRGLVAKIGAKGGTPEVSMILNKKVIMETVDVAIRPKVNFFELAQNPEKLMEIIDQSVVAMENAMVRHIQDALYTTFSALSAPNYASGAGIIKATLDSQMQALGRFGAMTLMGDYTQLQQLTALTGFSNRVPEKYMIEHNEVGYLGMYNKASVLELNNRFVDDTSLDESNLVLRDDLIFGLYTGTVEDRPLKVFVGGGTRAMDQTHIEDESYEMIMRKTFGSLVVGNQKRMFIYEDTNE